MAILEINMATVNCTKVNRSMAQQIILAKKHTRQIRIARDLAFAVYQPPLQTIAMVYTMTFFSIVTAYTRVVVWALYLHAVFSVENSS